MKVKEGMRRKLVYAEEVLEIVRPYLEDGDDYVENTAQEIIEAVGHLTDVMELLDEGIQYYREVAEEYMQGCLREQRMGRDGDFFYQCYLVNSGRADGLMEFRAEVEEMIEGKGFDENKFLKEFTSEA